ncbi:MAG: 2,3-bisphosphoglycerate-independent phosphoglycerate mutase [Pseudomonadales bacterium]|nr:2,3-bisphosphoglycerate-independent phosphoglycerate mutase [Pseudomonadales bacterium]
MTKKVPHVLIILDGWGYREAAADNAISLATTPTWDRLWAERPHTLISGSGLDVGLPDGQMGNSEVGHMTLGAGRVIDQDLTKITKAVSDGSFFTNPVIRPVMDSVAASDKAVHIMGLLSPGGVHSHEDHLKAAVSLAFQSGVRRVWVHGFLDGRDVTPRSAESSLRDMQAHIEREAAAHGARGGIASVVGRYYAMDRDNRWERVAPAYALLTEGKGEFTAPDPVSALMASYERDQADEFVKPTAIEIDGDTVSMADGDAVLFMNFRADRAREMTRAFVDADFSGFDRAVRPDLAGFICLTEYAADIDTPCAYGPDDLSNSMGEFMEKQGKTQLRIAETEKYAHVTFFYSGGRENEYQGETRILVPSPDVATYDLQPEMSAPEVTEKLVAAITSGEYDLIVCNFANGDMVGHTGVLPAAIRAVECVDHCLQQVTEAVEQAGGHCLITADHGNVEQMSDPVTGQPHTAHTSDLVPLIYVGDRAVELLPKGGKLSDVSPTLLDLMGVDQPEEMTGQSLLTAVATRMAGQQG